MGPLTLVYTAHAIRQMFAREITVENVQAVVSEGQVIADYPEDQPLASRLLLGFRGRRPLHVVLAVDEAAGVGYVVTAYEPDPTLWESDSRTRRKP